MAITASAMYGLTLEKIFKKTQDDDLESETEVYVMLVTNTYAPNFETHDFRLDVTNEIANGNGYTTGGQLMTGTELAVGSPAAGQMNYDTVDPAWAASTITLAMAGIHYFTTGASGTDQLIFLSDFVTAATSNNGTFTIQVHANGWWYIDYTP